MRVENLNEILRMKEILRELYEILQSVPQKPREKYEENVAHMFWNIDMFLIMGGGNKENLVESLLFEWDEMTNQISGIFTCSLLKRPAGEDEMRALRLLELIHDLEIILKGFSTSGCLSVENF